MPADLNAEIIELSRRIKEAELDLVAMKKRRKSLSQRRFMLAQRADPEFIDKINRGRRRVLPEMTKPQWSVYCKLRYRQYLPQQEAIDTALKVVPA